MRAFGDISSGSKLGFASARALLPHQMLAQIQKLSAALDLSEERLRQANKAIRRLEKGLLEVTGREQDRIGREVHDGLCQSLIAIGFTGRRLERKLLGEKRSEALEVNEICDRIDQAVAEARHLARGLYPVKLEKLGLGLALLEMAEDIGKHFQIACLFEYPAPIVVNDRNLVLHLYRIAQEAVTNALKHGHAKRITIELLARDKQIHLRVMDDGCGLVKKRQPCTGSGLDIMASRARIIGGTFEIQPHWRGGTIVSCSCPQPNPSTMRHAGSRSPAYLRS